MAERAAKEAYNYTEVKTGGIFPADRFLIFEICYYLVKNLLKSIFNFKTRESPEINFQFQNTDSGSFPAQ